MDIFRPAPDEVGTSTTEDDSVVNPVPEPRQFEDLEAPLGGVDPDWVKTVSVQA